MEHDGTSPLGPWTTAETDCHSGGITTAKLPHHGTHVSLAQTKAPMAHEANTRQAARLCP